MRVKLKRRREEMGYTQESFAIDLGVSIKTIQHIEQGIRFPREELLIKIMEKLKITSMEYFENIDIKSSKVSLKPVKVLENIREFMNVNSKKVYSSYDVSAINSAIMDYFKQNKGNKKGSNRTKEKKKILNSNIAKIANERLMKDCITADDVQLFKKCKMLEFHCRTGKCSWGFPNARISLGFNPDTGYEER